MPATILKVENAPYEDGLRLKVTFSEAPGAGLAFYSRPFPGVPATAQYLRPHVQLSPTEFEVQVVDGVTLKARVHRMPMYVRADNNLGTLGERPEWLCAGENTGWLKQVDDALNDLLVANRVLLNRSLELALKADVFPSGRPATVQKIHRGTVQAEDSATYPRICHLATTFAEDWYGNPYSDLVPITAQIEVYSGYQNASEWAFLIQELGMAVINVLNQPENTEIRLDSQMTAFFCQVTNGVFREYFDGSIEAWIMSFTMTWQGKLHAGKYHPNLYESHA